MGKVVNKRERGVCSVGRLSIRGRGECAKRKPWWAEGRQCCGVWVGNSVRRPKRRADSGL